MSFETTASITTRPPGLIDQEVIYIGDPEKGQRSWLFGTIQKSPGPHMICDLNGKGLKWSEVENGMEVKIKAKNVLPRYPTFEWLYSSEGDDGKYLIYCIYVNFARI